MTPRPPRTRAAIATTRGRATASLPAMPAPPACSRTAVSHSLRLSACPGRLGRLPLEDLGDLGLGQRLEQALLEHLCQLGEARRGHPLDRGIDVVVAAAQRHLGTEQ